jgi:hypothetical protein
MLVLSTNLVTVAQGISKPMVMPASVIKDNLSLAYYKRDYLRLAEDFNAYDVKLHLITKHQFLKALTTGGYFPLRLTSTNKIGSYQLYKYPKSVSKDIKSSVIQFATTYLQHYEMEGKLFPNFHFVDINGKKYDRDNTRGKILVLKSWFIACQACNEEMPALNKLADKYKNNKDMLFVSIAFDSKPL